MKIYRDLIPALLLVLGVLMASSSVGAARDLSDPEASKMFGGAYPFKCDIAGWAGSVPGDPLTCEGATGGLPSCGKGNVGHGDACTICDQRLGPCGSAQCLAWEEDHCSQGITSGLACDCGYKQSGICMGANCQNLGPPSAIRCLSFMNTCLTNLNTNPGS